MQLDSHEQELKDRIMKSASEMFFEHGIRQVRMDDIAHNLGISKRTLYEIYDNKEQLLLDVVKYNNDEHVKKMADFARKGTNTVEILAEFYRLQMKRVSAFYLCFFDVLHGYDKVLDYLRGEKDKNMRKHREFIDKAIQEGYFVDNLDYNIIDVMLTCIRDHVFTSKTLKQYSQPAIFRTVIMVFLRGICTQKGIRQLDALMKIIDTQE